ncbi:tripeptidyl-peptidase 2-like isoform X1 [Camellia sinensis]|uniref:tripeptidyl-peptidase 2-like isoform X1 n=1 Tax=Camellia sinensis TaxID=4442 RepID=UPI001035B5E0|nr:tripeptidyl-peptidase 2-like isoform X1 [Camellia sinensis]
MSLSFQKLGGGIYNCHNLRGGASLVVNSSWKNPSGEWHVGCKLVYELFTDMLTSRLKKERKKKWDEKHQEAIAEAVKCLDEFDKKHVKVEDANLKRAREDLQNKVDFLRKQADGYEGACYRCCCMA